MTTVLQFFVRRVFMTASWYLNLLIAYRHHSDRVLYTRLPITSPDLFIAQSVICDRLVESVVQLHWRAPCETG